MENLDPLKANQSDPETGTGGYLDRAINIAKSIFPDGDPRRVVNSD